jgi:glycosyltransferase involved in cell wall biosynthesis
VSTARPTLDVVIPCYNEERDIARCLDLLLEQHAEIRRIIVVDNNSTDGTAAILQEYGSRYAIVQILQETRQGVEFARDTGMAQAHADVVARIDVDARVQPGWAAALRDFYGSHPDAQAGTGATEYFDLPARRFANMVTWFFMTMSNQVMAGSVNLYGANMSIRLQAWNMIKTELPSREAHVMEDLAISLALERRHQKIVYIPAALAHVSGRRMRTSPRDFARYNAQWPNTYHVMGFPRKARTILPMSWLGNVLQCGLALLLRFHDPVSGKFSVSAFRHGYEGRELP